MYEIRESACAKHLRIRIEPDGTVVVTKPVRVSTKAAEAFVAKHHAWIEESLAKLERRRKRVGELLLLPRPRKSSKAYKEAREAARALVTERLKALNALYGFRYGTISIRDQKTRWGSCSAAGNLSFNYRIVYLPPVLQDYVIVHELSHVKEHNHSERFWALVAKSLPGYKILRKELRRYAS